MVTQLVLLLPHHDRNARTRRGLREPEPLQGPRIGGRIRGARYAAANPDKNDSEVESYVKGAIGLDGSCTVDIERGALSSKDVKLRVGDKSRDSSIERKSVTVNVQIPCRRVFTSGRLRWSCGNWSPSHPRQRQSHRRSSDGA